MSVTRDELQPGQLVVYMIEDECEICKVKRIADDGAFLWSNNGDTAAKAPFEFIHLLANAYTIMETSLGGTDGLIAGELPFC